MLRRNLPATGPLGLLGVLGADAVVGPGALVRLG
jgi:hypothetical protein